jgi:hypothetical protein
MGGTDGEGALSAPAEVGRRRLREPNAAALIRTRGLTRIAKAPNAELGPAGSHRLTASGPRSARRPHTPIGPGWLRFRPVSTPAWSDGKCVETAGRVLVPGEGAYRLFDLVLWM